MRSIKSLFLNLNRGSPVPFCTERPDEVTGREVPGLAPANAYTLIELIELIESL